MENIEGFIFDYGGTIDSRGVHWSWVIWDGYRHAGAGLGLEQFREAYVYAERELARVRHIMPGDNFHDLLVKKMAIEFDYIEQQGWLEGCAALEPALLLDIVKLDGHLLHEQVVEVVAWHDVAHAGQLALGVDIGLAKLLQPQAGTGVAVAVPYHPAPVHAAAVDRATVIKNEAFNIFHLAIP